MVEITAPNGAPVPNGQQGTIVLNPNPTNPELENPELENPELENPELENAEVHDLDMANPTVRNPELENPELENPELENPELENATVVNPSILNPELENPELENPELENPELENPELENADLVNGALSDTTWTITNKGNTSGMINRQARTQWNASRWVQKPADRAQDLSDTGCPWLLAPEADADRPPCEHSQPQVRGPRRVPEPGARES